MSLDDYNKSVILRSNSGMIRDCYWDNDTQDPTKWVFVIRQVKFDADESNGVVKTKIFRFEEEEIKILVKCLASRNS